MLRIQSANRERKLAHKVKLTFVEYYWENMIIEMSKTLLSSKNNLKTATQISYKLYTIKPEIKFKILKLYGEYCRQVFTGKFYDWRRRLHLFKGDPPNINLNTTLK